MAISLIYGGVDLSKWLRVTDVVRDIGTNRTNTLQKVGVQDGKTLISATDDEGTITVSGYTVSDLNAKRREMAAALHPTEVTRLIIGDEPDKYYMAVVDGQATMAETYRLGKVSIKFVVPDGRAHAVAMQSINTDATGLATIDYTGTAPTYPIITATMQSENGYAAFATENGGVAFGDPEEVDTVAGTRSDKAVRIDFDANDPNDYNVGDIKTNAYPLVYTALNWDSKTPNAASGSVDKTASQVWKPVYDDTSTTGWNGPNIGDALTANYAGSRTGDFDMQGIGNFYSSRGDRAHYHWDLLSNGDVKYSLAIRSSSATRDDLVVEFWHDHNVVWTQDVSNLKGDFRKLADQGGGTNGYYNFAISRRGNKVSFSVSRVKKWTNGLPSGFGATVGDHFTWAGESDVPITDWTSWIARFQKSKAGYACWSGFQFTWVNEPTLTNVPNLFSAGDVLVIDAGAKKIYLNGVESRLWTLGNDFGALAIADTPTLLQAEQSTWANPMAVTVNYQEAYY
jgi:predicted phage tail component-like protein